MWRILKTKAANLAVSCLGVTALCVFTQYLAAQTATIQQYNFNPARIVAGGYIPDFIESACGDRYLRTDIGGVYRWDTNQWTQLLDWVRPSDYNLTGPESIATDPNNCNMLYIAAGMYTTTNDWAIHVSSNKGETFTTYPETTFEMASNDNGRATGERLVVNPFNSNELLFGSRHNSIQRSTNQGQTWTEIATSGAGSLPFTADTGPYGIQFVLYDPCYSNETGCGTSGSTARVFAGEYGTTGAASTNHGLYVSNNDGATWTLLAGQPTAWNGGTGLNLGIVPNFTSDTCVSSSSLHLPSPQKAVIAPDGFLYVLWDDLPGPNTVCYGAVTKYDLTSAATGWTNITPPYDAVNDAAYPAGGYVGLTLNRNTTVGSPATIAVSTEGRKSIANCCNVDAVYISHNSGNTWENLSSIQGSSDPAVPQTNGDDGAYAGAYYYNTSVYNSGNVETSAPYLTFGDWEDPVGPPYTSAYVGWWMSSLFLDSFNPNTVMYSTGAFVFRTDDASNATPNWYLNGWGIEETAGLALASPAGPPSTADPTTGGHLMSGTGDIGGFLHTNFNESPGTGGSNTVPGSAPYASTPGMYTNPVFLDTGSIDWAGQHPSLVVRAGTPISTTTSPCSSGGWSAGAGVNGTWSPFSACASGTSGSDTSTIAVDASGMEVMWGSGTTAQYILNTGTPSAPVFGSTWTTTTGTHSTAWADKVEAKMFYSWDSGHGFYCTASACSAAGVPNGTIWVATASNPSTTTTGSCQGSGCGRVMVNPYVAGDIWLPLGTNGLFHSTNFGASWTKITNVTSAFAVSVGAPVPGTSENQVILYGTLTSATQPASMISAIYRSDNATPTGTATPTWIQINDYAHQFGGATLVIADSTVYGQFYMTMNGRGVIYGAPTASTVTTSPAGLSFSVDGTGYNSPQNFPWVPLSSHTLQVTSPQTVGSTKYTFTGWTIPGSTSTSNPLSVTVPAPPTSPGAYVANFASSAGISLPLKGTLTGKSGESESRAWTITLTNPANVPVTGAQIDSLSLHWTGGTECQPSISTPLPLSVGTIAASGGTATGTVYIDFIGEGCTTSSMFQATFTFSGSTGSGSTTLNNQFQ
jgi:oligoxyloglucan reducing-end-specific cellobiohydrolase